MSLPLMPKATAVWLIENTTLSFEQIAHFCGLHPLEVQGIADGDVATGLVGQDPVASGQLTWEEINLAVENPKKPLKISESVDKYIKEQRKAKSRYTPVARRQDKPDAISWFIKNHPEISDATIAKLVGTTKNTINSVKDKSHWNSSNIKPKDPVLLGLCTQTDLFAAIEKANKGKKKPDQQTA